MMGKRPLNPNRATDHMDVLVIKEQLEEVKGQVSELSILLGGSEVGPTKTKGLIAMVVELVDKVDGMIGAFQHNEKWRVNQKNAQVENEARNEKRRLQAEEREYQAQVIAQQQKRELEQREEELARSKTQTRNRTILAVIMAVAGFLAKELYQHLIS